MAIVGIDLGTTFSAVAALGSSGMPVVLPNSESELITQSVILFDSESNILVGREAKRAAVAEPDRVVEGVKRYMGDEFFPLEVGGQKYSPVFLSSMILKKLVQDAERRVGPITGAVVTVPAYFDESRRQATVAACLSANLAVIDIINEPTAAALAFVFKRLVEKGGDPHDAGRLLEDGAEKRTVVVYDLGGGTFDVTVLRCEGRTLRVLATAGDVQLGGRDWDRRIFDFLAEEFIRSGGRDPRNELISKQQLSETSEQVKKELSQRPQARFVISHFGHSLKGALSRERFDALTADLLFRTESRLMRVIRETGLAWDKIDDLLVVGGSTRMPQVLEMLRRVTGHEPNRSLSPDEAVAQGAAIHAAICMARAGEKKASQEKAAGADSEEAVEREVLLVDHEGFMNRMGQKMVSLLGTIRTNNVTAHSLGIVASDRHGKKKVVRMIARNTPLPTVAKQTFGTEVVDQRRVSIHVVEGEADTPEDCNLVGTCDVTELPTKLPKASPVEVTFRYDNSGRLHVEAVHLTSGAWAEAVVKRSSGVDPERIKFNQELLSRLTIS